MSKVLAFAALMILGFTAPGCARKGEQRHRFDSYRRIEDVQHIQIATKRDAPGGRLVVAKKSRAVVHVRGKKRADFDILVSSRQGMFMPSNAADDLDAPPDRPIRKAANAGDPRNAPNARNAPNTKASNAPPILAMQAPPSTTPSNADLTDGVSSTMTSFPFFLLENGWAYITGSAPAAQTEHVVAGSDSTTFALEIDRNGQDDPMLFTHRLYVFEASSAGVHAVVLDDYGNETGESEDVLAGKYIEISYDAAAREPRWRITRSSTNYPTGGGTFHDLVIAAADAANLYTP
jgi:hypothetical protein